MFSNAKKVDVVKSAVKSGKPTKTTDTYIGWEELAALDAASKALNALVELRKGSARETLQTVFIERGIRKNDKPDSLSPIEGEAVGSAFVTKRTSLSVLAQDEIELIAECSGVAIAEDGSVPGYVDVVETLPSLLAVNPAYANDAELLKKIDKALSGIKGIPTDFIIQTEVKSKCVVSDRALSNMFRLDPASINALFSVLAGISIRPVFSGTLEKAWSIIKPLIPEATTALETAPKKSRKSA